MMSTITVGDLVHGPATTVDAKATLDVVAHTLGDLGIGLVVVMEKGSVVGVISERDIIWAIARDAELDEVWAADVMTEDLVTVEPDLSLKSAGSVMARQNARHLLVMHGDRPGVVSMRDVLERLTESTDG